MIRKAASGTIIPRDDGKLIDEHVGAVHTKTDAYSVARMVAPPGWKEPAQTAQFDELVLVVQGRWQWRLMAAPSRWAPMKAAWWSAARR